MYHYKARYKDYCRTADGKIVEIDVKDVPYKDCPECVIQAFLSNDVPEAIE
jgi:hypothetical protein